MGKLEFKSKKASNAVLLSDTKFKRLANFDSNLDNLTRNMNDHISKLEEHKRQVMSFSNASSELAQKQIDSLRGLVYRSLFIAALSFAASVLILVKHYL